MILLDLLAVGFGILALWGSARAVKCVRAGFRRKHGRCIACGYSLAFGTGKCPECGTVDAERRVPSGAWIAVAPLSLGVAACTVFMRPQIAAVWPTRALIVLVWLEPERRSAFAEELRRRATWEAPTSADWDMYLEWIVVPSVSDARWGIKVRESWTADLPVRGELWVSEDGYWVDHGLELWVQAVGEPDSQVRKTIFREPLPPGLPRMDWFERSDELPFLKCGKEKIEIAADLVVRHPTTTDPVRIRSWKVEVFPPRCEALDQVLPRRASPMPLAQVLKAECDPAGALKLSLLRKSFLEQLPMDTAIAVRAELMVDGVVVVTGERRWSRLVEYDDANEWWETTVGYVSNESRSRVEDLLRYPYGSGRVKCRITTIPALALPLVDCRAVLDLEGELEVTRE